MVDNPFSVNSLAGVSFDGDHVGNLPASYDSTGLTKGYKLWAYNSWNYRSGNPAIYGTTDERTGGVSVVGTGEITIVSSVYSPPGTWGTSGQNYQNPIFGQIKFANSPNIYNILGLARTAEVFLYQLGPTTYEAFTVGDVGRTFVLSLDPLPVYTDANPAPTDEAYHFDADPSNIDAFEHAVCLLRERASRRRAAPSRWRSWQKAIWC